MGNLYGKSTRLSPAISTIAARDERQITRDSSWGDRYHEQERINAAKLAELEKRLRNRAVPINQYTCPTFDKCSIDKSRALANDWNLANRGSRVMMMHVDEATADGTTCNVRGEFWDRSAEDWEDWNTYSGEVAMNYHCDDNYGQWRVRNTTETFESYLKDRAY